MRARDILLLHVVRVGTTPVRGLIKGRTRNLPTSQIDQLGRASARDSIPGSKLPAIPHDQSRVSSPINNSYCVTKLQEELLAGSQNSTRGQTINTNVNSHVVKVAHTAPGHSQRKEISPVSADCYYQKEYKLKYVKGVSCVTQLSWVKPVTNVKIDAPNLPVGARLQNFWQAWLDLGAGPKVENQTSLGFFNRLFLVPKANNKWRPILDLSNLNQFLKVQKFKMET